MTALRSPVGRELPRSRTFFKEQGEASHSLKAVLILLGQYARLGYVSHLGIETLSLSLSGRPNISLTPQALLSRLCHCHNNCEREEPKKLTDCSVQWLVGRVEGVPQCSPKQREQRAHYVVTDGRTDGAQNVVGPTDATAAHLPSILPSFLLRESIVFSFKTR